MSVLTRESPGVWLIDDFVDEAQCQQWIEWSEARGYEAAGFSGRHGSQRVEAVRNNDRIIEDNDDRAAQLWSLLSSQMPEDWHVRQMMRRGAVGTFEVCGLNSRFRWYRYAHGQRFRPHVDSMFVRSDGAVSLATVLLYLSGDILGGQTRVEFKRGGQVVIEPSVGRLVCFDHDLMHEGMPIDQGMKYILRTDLMWRPVA